ncbi:MAG: ATPase, T2SS/T4P/T4SS family [Planctomycetota bacterium]
MKAGETMDNTRLGSILLENPLMRQEDIERCLEIQALTGGTRPLGEILIQEGVISGAMLEELLAIQQSRRADTRGTAVVEGTGILSYLRSAVEHKASDLIMSEGRNVLIRTGGQLRELTSEPIASKDLFDFLTARFGADVMTKLAEAKTVSRDFCEEGLARGRIAAFRHFDGLCVTIRLHPTEVRDPQASGLPVELLRALGQGKGMILICGEVRSGITETLASLLYITAKDKSRVVLVLDHDFEAPLPEFGAVATRRKIGVDTVNMASALRAATIEAPDVIFVGDASDVVTFDLALRAAEAGHLVVAAVRARSVVAALERVLNGYPAYDVPRVRTSLAAVVNCVMAQHLLPTNEREGAVLATEILVSNDASREIVRGGALTQLNLLMRLESSECGHSLDDSLIGLIETKRVRFEDAFVRAEDKTKLLQVAQKR